IRKAFAPAVFNRVCRFQHLSGDAADQWRNWISSHLQERRAIALNILRNLKQPSLADHLSDYNSPFITGDDFFWLIKLLQHSRSRRLRQFLSQLIWRCFDRENAGHADAIIVNAQRCKELRESSADMLEAWPLG